MDCNMKRPLRSRDELNPDDPITLKDACAIFFHDAITPKSLRTERDKGNLVTEKIAGREFVTPAAIAAMRERCQTGPKKAASPEPAPTSRDDVVGLGAYGRPFTRRDAERAKLQLLKESLPTRRQPS